MHKLLPQYRSQYYKLKNTKIPKQGRFRKIQLVISAFHSLLPLLLIIISVSGKKSQWVIQSNELPTFESLRWRIRIYCLDQRTHMPYNMRYQTNIKQYRCRPRLIKSWQSAFTKVKQIQLAVECRHWSIKKLPHIGRSSYSCPSSSV